MIKEKAFITTLIIAYFMIFSFYSTNIIPCESCKFSKTTMQYRVGKAKKEISVPCNSYPSTQTELKSLGDDDNYIRKKYDEKLNLKEVFLTFDDGPSPVNTPKILEILKKNGVKATFFIIGKRAEEYPEIMKKLKEAGMCIATHTYSHDYKIYRSEDAYWKDYEACTSAIMKFTGSEVTPYLRLPGGSGVNVSNKAVLRSIKDKLINNNLRYVDWNVSSADAAMQTVPASMIKNNVISQCKGKKIAVVLMHDANTKTTTVEALPDIIKYLKDSGYVFKTFESITATEENHMNKIQIMNR